MSTGSSPEPTPQEMAAIVAAYDALWPQPVAASTPPSQVSSRWRFSGRWWSDGRGQRGGQPPWS